VKTTLRLLVLAAAALLAPAARAQETAPIASAALADIDRHVHDLASKNGWVSLDALDYLGYFGKAALPALLDGLASVDSNTRVLAAIALGRVPDARSVPRLIEALDDKGGLALNTLTQDGESMQPVYSPPEHTVGQQARLALALITGQRFAKKAEWLAWWANAEATFTPPPLREVEWPRFPEQARWLKGVKVCLDPGHGGDRSKIGFKRGLTYLSEADLNLRVGRYLRDLLVRAGATVSMTREGDQDVSLAERCRIAGKTQSDFFLSIHHNWDPSVEVTKTSTWYHTTPDAKPASIDLARAVQEEVAKVFDPPDTLEVGGLKSDNLIYKTGFGVLRGLPESVPGALCELTYYSNFAMERKLRDLEFNRKEAWGLFLGLVRYLAAGIPRAELVSSDGDLVLQVQDGLEGRGEWQRPFKVFFAEAVVKLDGKVVAHEDDPATGKIKVAAASLDPGEHAVEVLLQNLNGNHSWPRRIAFTR
jgi:N-acetylmuramoyl-L-alanine amidase